jgi:hypothetical protein
VFKQPSRSLTRGKAQGTRGASPMKFFVEGVLQKTVTVKTNAHISITKKEVMRVTDCPSVIDGDSTGWYSYVEEALMNGAKFTLTNSDEIKLDEESNFIELTDVAW